ncbi:MAG: UDP-N-acetylmuramoyl-tripeptide--D-alanyl-D-alanine ligase [Terriglobia bacterium]|jgi:UDP-N-acetylmuramoyl-tripeptide--D-alanyl-D-alanine ligase
MKLSLGEIATLLHSRCGVPEREVIGYSLDSRSIGPGQLFFAMRGPRFDGHEFIAQVFEGKAAGAVVENAFFDQAPPELKPALIPVESPLESLQHLARAVRRKWGRPLIAVTGSTGKSTTKEMIAALLGRCFAVHKSAGNLNNHYGLPLTLLGLDPEHEIAVVELAMSRAGEIAHLALIAEPETGAVTNVAPVHLEFFDSVDSIAKAKRELVENLSSRGGPPTAVLNYDDPRVRGFAEGFEGQVITFGMGSGADFQALWVKPGEGIGSEFHVVGPNLDCDFLLPILGRHNVQNALAAIAVASDFDIPAVEMRRGLAEFQNMQQRGESFTLPGPVTIINDSYNSNPQAMESMLETLRTWPGARRRIIVAGEMLELGPQSPKLHEEVGRKCAEADPASLIAVQGDARFFVEGAVAAGMATARTRFFPDAPSAGEFCRSKLEPGDVVLVKGSRGVHLEAVVAMLKGESKVESSKSKV